MRRQLSALSLLLVCAIAVRGAQVETPNFIVQAQDPQVAQMVAKYAEYYRKQRAIDWLGREMPNWPQPCPLVVKVSMHGPRGATSFRFGGGQVQDQHMNIEGPLERLLNSVLPHEITHTVFAHQFRRPLPRWADEGGSVLSEDDTERDRHDKLTRQLMQRNKLFPLRTLFGMMQYPNHDQDVMKLYAQGFSVVDFLVKRGNRQVFLNFLGQALSQGWDASLQRYYNIRSVEELESAWLRSLKEPRSPGAPIQLATAPQNSNGAAAPNALGRFVRMTVPTYGETPVYRGAAPNPDEMGQRFGQHNPEPIGQRYGQRGDERYGQQPPRPNGYAPQQYADSIPSLPAITINPEGWRPANPQPQPTFPVSTPQSQYPVPVTLGSPQFHPAVPSAPSPIGYPR
jgi:hypothetical protein